MILNYREEPRSRMVIPVSMIYENTNKMLVG